MLAVLIGGLLLAVAGLVVRAAAGGLVALGHVGCLSGLSRCENSAQRHPAVSSSTPPALTARCKPGHCRPGAIHLMVVRAESLLPSAPGTHKPIRAHAQCPEPTPLL